MSLTHHTIIEMVCCIKDELWNRGCC